MRAEEGQIDGRTVTRRTREASAGTGGRGHLAHAWTGMDAVAPGRTAVWATFGGWALNAYNQMTVGIVLPTITTPFALSSEQAGLLGNIGR